MRHGPIDDVSPERKGGDGTGAPPAKECPQCEMIIHAAARHCPYCGFEFPEPEPKIERKPTARAILKADIGPTEMDVTQTFYEVHKKYGRPDSVKISYWCGIQLVREWVFPESGSDRGNWSYINFCRKAGIKSPPRTAAEFVALCPDGPVKIWTMPKGKWTEVVRRQYAD